MNSLSKLLNVSSPLSDFYSLTEARETIALDCAKMLSTSMKKELEHLLNHKNGFLAFESSLHCFSSNLYDGVPSLDEWNSGKWREFYSSVPKEAVFFAQDAFLEQFAIIGEGIFKFMPETGNLEHFSEGIDSWADEILANYNYETGWEVAHEWQVKNQSSLLATYRLMPRIPFTLGGEYDPENLFAEHPSIGMQKIAHFHKNLSHFTDGEKVSLDQVLPKSWLRSS